MKDTIDIDDSQVPWCKDAHLHLGGDWITFRKPTEKDNAPLLGRRLINRGGISYASSAGSLFLVDRRFSSREELLLWIESTGRKPLEVRDDAILHPIMIREI